MGSIKEPNRLQIIDNPGVPDFFVTEIVRRELVGNCCVRVYVAARRGNVLIVQYTYVVPLSSLEEMGRGALAFVAEHARKIGLDLPLSRHH